MRWTAGRRSPVSRTKATDGQKNQEEEEEEDEKKEKVKKMSTGGDGRSACLISRSQLGETLSAFRGSSSGERLKCNHVTHKLAQARDASRPATGLAARKSNFHLASAKSF